MNRRDFLKVMGASAGTALAAACDRPPSKLVSTVKPDDTLPGEAKLVRSICTECPAGCGMVAKVRDGRPVKLEGDPDAPNRGALCMRGQASLSRLYHPDRLKTPLFKGPDGKFHPLGWDEAFAFINGALSKQTTGRQNVFLSRPPINVVRDQASTIGHFCKTRGVERLWDYDLYSHATLCNAYEIVFHVACVPSYVPAKADFLLTVGADVLETFGNPVHFVQGLGVAKQQPGFQWVHVEPHLSLTGINADQRLMVLPQSEAWLLAHLADVLGVTAEKAAAETGLPVESVISLAGAVRAAKRPLVIVGGVATAHEQGLLAAVCSVLLQTRPEAPLDWWNIAQWGIPATLEPRVLPVLADLEKRLLADNIGVVFINDINAVAYRPGLGQALAKAAIRVGFGDLLDETLSSCNLVLPLSHTLETACKGSPVEIAPLFDTRPLDEILVTLAGKEVPHSRGLPPGFSDALKPMPDSTSVKAFLAKTELKPTKRRTSLVVVPSIRTFDGRSDTLPLLSEIPDPLTTVTYGPWVTVSPEMGVKDREVIELSVAGKKLAFPARVMPGQPANVFTVQRPFLKGVTLPLTESGEEAAVLVLESVRATGAKAELPVMAGGMHAEGRGILPEHNHKHGEQHVNTTLYPPHEHKHYRWAMAIDLDRCTGCGACVAACYIENNIPVVGPAEHNAGREMSWLRLEPFVQEGGGLELLPMMCQQCDHAPCEPVCPVLATYHTEEGLNGQVYNRCVGTRYCANNCPFKVRRFNWQTNPASLALNPDVSKRPAGVMEKCTFCVHRIVKAKDHAKDEHRLVRDGEFTTACAETCPAQAIMFGNMLDEKSRVHALAHDARAYRVLEELGTQPAVYYLKAKRT